MKLGKKALSCLLAVIMIMTSVSVCFSVLGAYENLAKGFVTAVLNDYDGLYDAITAYEDDSDTAKTFTKGGVLVQGSNNAQYVVATDTTLSGWR